ncbi:MAG TPA: hypothetical protein PKZ32_19220 [Candidatus Melainabacteria bacterium]|nr:hypothetical protein [Candidatus Melainabacteria bacterium]
MTEESHELAVLDMPILNPEHIQPQDYLRPIVGATIYAMVFTFPMTMFALGLGVSPFRLLSFQFGVVSTIIGTLLISAMIHHFVWWRRLKNHGASAFVAYEDVDLPLEETFELCLGATTQLPKSKIETFEEGKTIQLRVKGNFWVTVDRMVDIKFQSLGENKTRVIVDSAFKLTPARTFLISKIWGPKWTPIVFRLDIRKNKEMLMQITDYLRRIPEWNHKYVFGDSFDSLTNEKVA